jgi:hypothetical protein
MDSEYPNRQTQLPETVPPKTVIEVRENPEGPIGERGHSTIIHGSGEGSYPGGEGPSS